MKSADLPQTLALWIHVRGVVMLIYAEPWRRSADAAGTAVDTLIGWAPPADSGSLLNIPDCWVVPYRQIGGP